MDVKTMKKWLRRFAAIDRDKNGFITVEDFAKFLHLPNDACLQAVFTAANVVKKINITIVIFLQYRITNYYGDNDTNCYYVLFN